MKFNEYNWHDAIVRSIKIDRSNPGVNDEIFLDIEWTDGKTYLLKFKNVYWSSMTLNFGIVAEESISKAGILEKDDVDLVNFYSSWNGLMNDVRLNVFYIEFNSTGSIIKIIAEDYELIIKKMI